MPKNIFKTLSLAGLAFVTLKTAQASVDQSVPSLNPNSACLVHSEGYAEGVRDYRFLTNDNCRKIFVLPELIGRQYIDYSIMGDLDMCMGLKLATDRMNQIQKDISVQSIRLGKETNEHRRKHIEEHISDLEKRLRHEIEQRDFVYGDQPGARFSIVNDNDVLDQDLAKVALNNLYQVIAQEPGQPPQIFEKKPAVQKANIVDSYYTFFYRKSSERERFESLLESKIPAKVISSNPFYGLVHVEGGNAVTADLRMNLPSICLGAMKDEQGEWVLKENYRNPMFTLTRTFEVKQRAAYGYDSAMKIDEVKTLLASYIQKTGNQPFTIDDVFLSAAENNLKEYLDFNWSQQMGDDGGSLSNKRIKEIKLNLFSTHLKNYFDDLVSKGVLQIAGIKNVGEKDGQFISGPNPDLNGYKSPLTQKCHVEAYQVKAYAGQVDAELRDMLHVNQDFTKVVGVNKMEPTVFRSIFKPVFVKKQMN